MQEIEWDGGGEGVNKPCRLIHPGLVITFSRRVVFPSLWSYAAPRRIPLPSFFPLPAHLLSFVSVFLWLILILDSKRLLETNWPNPLLYTLGKLRPGEVEQRARGHPASCGPAPSSTQDQCLCSVWLLLYVPGRCSTSSGNFLTDILRKNKANKHERCLWKAGS